jgi:hypothetical protein
MQEKSKLTLKILVLCLVFNGILLAGLYGASERVLLELHARVAPLLAGPDVQSLPETVRTAHLDLQAFLQARDALRLPVLLGLGGLVTLLLGCALLLAARGALKRCEATNEPARAPKEKAGERKKAEKGTGGAQKMEPERPSPYPAVQILSALQREGRFVDFLQEDLAAYEDAQIGAAVRSIHEGCRKAIAEHVELKPVYEQEEEGSQVTVKPGFDARAVRLTGNVSGHPPFRGVLRHRGWQVMRMELPVPVAEHKEKRWVLAPAEVEIEG